MNTVAIEKLRKSKSILLYDGVCTLCDHSVQFVLKYDRNKRFLFGQLDSKTAKIFLKQQEKDYSKIDSVVFIDDKSIYTKSSAALKVLTSLGGLWQVAGIFYILPKFLRDKVYDYIARHRYAWFGKMPACRIPTEEESARFID